MPIEPDSKVAVRERLKSARYCGIDPSLSCTAMVFLDQDGQVCWSDQIATTPQDFPRGILDRLDVLQQAVFERLSMAPLIDLTVCIEGFAMGARNGREVAGALGYLYRLCARRAACLIEIAPTSLKKYTAANGTADKSTMMREVFRLWDYDANGNDDADARALADVAYRFCRPDVDPALRQHQREALKKVIVLWRG
jgi:Holliday junction resolvasome RuvABC endonuclease subunit